MSLASLMIHTCTIQTLSSTKTATGFAQEGNWPVTATVVRCRVTDQTPDRAMIVYGKFDRNSQKRVYFDTDQSLDVNTRLVWVDPSGTTWTLYVHSIENQGGSLNRLWAVDVANYED